MKELLNEFAKEKYIYHRYNVEEVDASILRKLLLLNKKEKRRSKGGMRSLKSYKIGGGKYGKYFLDVNMSFDIETYTDQEYQLASMYIWQMGINGNVIIGRTWESFRELLDLMKEVINPSPNQRIICFIHNLNYEFSFMRYWLDIDDYNENFFKADRSPLFVTHDHFIQFRDSMSMTNSPLEKLAKDYTNTQKLADEETRIDYSIARNRKTELSELELQYCDNDVLILSEFSEYFYKTYLSNGKNPLTLTSALYKEVLEEFEKVAIELGLTPVQLRYITDAYKCRSKDEYIETMNFCYRGGFTHGSILFIECLFTILDKIKSYDITSSYPASALLQYMPSVWMYDREDEDFTQEAYEELIKDKCAIAFFKFKNIKHKYHHSLESESKVISISEEKEIDNGRVLSAASMTVMLTELDYLNYKDLYEWESVKIKALRYSDRVSLYPWLMHPMLKYYVEKAALKEAGEPYAVEKAKVNIFYGLCCKRFNFETCIYDNLEGWSTVEAKKSYEAQSRDSVLNPYIGIYISAHSRRSLIEIVAKMEAAGHPVLYCDTDSIKVLNADATTEKIIADYNKMKDFQIRKLCHKYKVDYRYVHDLGKYDEEYSEGITRFKYLGAKRYLLSYMKNGKEVHTQTVAGLPKSSLFKRQNSFVDGEIVAAKEGYKIMTVDDIYEEFNDDMIVSDCKLTSIYADSEYDLKVGNLIQHERSGVALVDANFTLNIDEMWLHLFAAYKDEYKHLEPRII